MVESVIEKAKNNELREDPSESARLRAWLEKLDPSDLGKYEN